MKRTRGEAPAAERFLLVQAGDRLCALPLARVRRVVRALPVCPLPGSAPELLGLAEFGGEPLPVLDLATLVGAPPPAGAAPPPPRRGGARPGGGGAPPRGGPPPPAAGPAPGRGAALPVTVVVLAGPDAAAELAGLAADAAIDIAELAALGAAGARRMLVSEVLVGNRPVSVLDLAALGRAP